MAGIALLALANTAIATPLRVPGTGFLRVLPEGTRPVKVEAAGETRATVNVPTTAPRQTVPVSEGGVIALDPEALPPLPPEALGYRIAYQYRDPSPLLRTKRTGYTFVPADSLPTAPVHLLPPGVPEPSAVYQVRKVLPVAQRHVSPPIAVPEGASLSWAVGLRQDWRVSRDAGASFTLALESEGHWHVLDQHTARVDDAIEDPTGWIPREADLEPFAGEVARLHFITQPVSGAPVPQFAAPLWATPILHVPDPPAPPPGPNVLLICLDTVRMDRLGVYGYPRGTSPNLDTFAADATVFEQAIAPAPWTTPTHASVFTGYHPDVHRAGVISAGYHLAPEWTTLAEILRDAGRVTAAYTEGIAVRGQMGFAQGFDVYSDGHSPDRHVKERAPRTFGDALDWLREFGHLPFFLFVQTYEAHEPYGAPEEYARRFIRGDLPLGNEPVMGGNANTPEERQRVSDLYDAAIAYTDEHLGRFLDGVRELGLLEETLVVIFSDHGEEFWEHGAVGHTQHVYDEVLRVPLIIRVPGRAGAGQRIARQVDLTDIFATVLEAIGRTPPDDTDAVSLMPLLEAREGYEREAVVSVLVNTSGDLLTGEGLPVEWRRAARRTESKKYIHSDREVHEGAAQPAEELYRLDADPAERDNHATDSPADLAAQRARLQQFEADKAAIRARHATTDAPGLSPEDIDALQSLGYL